MADVSLPRASEARSDKTVRRSQRLSHRPSIDPLHAGLAIPGALGVSCQSSQCEVCETRLVVKPSEITANLAVVPSLVLPRLAIRPRALLADVMDLFGELDLEPAGSCFWEGVGYRQSLKLLDACIRFLRRSAAFTVQFSLPVSILQLLQSQSYCTH